MIRKLDECYARIPIISTLGTTISPRNPARWPALRSRLPCDADFGPVNSRNDTTAEEVDFLGLPPGPNPRTGDTHLPDDV